MPFEWDAAKNEANLRERGFDYEFATLIFDGPTIEAEDRRRDYGERRIIAIGVVDRLHITVVYTDRRAGSGETARRIISARRSNRRERQVYERGIHATRSSQPGPR